MWQYIKYRWKRLFIILAIVGPGLITAFADNDAAGVATYSVSSAIFGYRILIITIPMTILLAITQEIAARIAAATEKGLADLIRERFGVRIAIFMYLLLFFVNLVVIFQDIGGIKAALLLFGLQPIFFLPAIVAALFLFVVLASYNIVERFFFILIGFYITYLASAFLAKPDWGQAMTSLVVPKGPWTPAFLYTSIAVIGTTITAWGQFFVHSYIKDKGLTTEHFKYTRIEVYLGAILTNTFSFFMMVAVAATLFIHKIPITDAASASIAIRPFAGEFAGVLFGVGLLVAGMMGCVIVPLTTAYAFSELFGYSGSLDENFRKSRLFYVTLLIQLVVGVAIVLLPTVSLFQITLFGNFINGMILPIVFYFLYQFANNETLMGAYRNTKIQNVLLVGGAVVITIASFVGVIGQLLKW